MARWKKNLLLIVFVLSGIILGALAAELAAKIPYLGWLSFGKTVGISPDTPLLLDLSVFRLAFGVELGINVAQVIMVLLGVLAYKKVVGRG